jgi:uncharacterized protein YjdB
MIRELFRIALGCLSSPNVRRCVRRFHAGSLPSAIELERRALLANITPTAVISATPSGANYTYTITLTDAKTSNATIGTFWYAWVPGQDYLATRPISVTPPTGWTANITNEGAHDGFAIEFTSSNASHNVPIGGSLTFKFTSADKPASVNGNSSFFPGIPVGTSFVYPTGPFSDGGHQFVVKPAAAAPTLVSIAISPAKPGVAKGETKQLSISGKFSDGSTKTLTGNVVWTSSQTGIATISSTGLVTAVKEGSTTITAKFSGKTATTVLNVTPAALLSIKVTPIKPTVSKNGTEQFAAVGSYSDHTTKVLTTQVTWTSSKATVATINKTTGLAKGVAQGTTTITAKLGSILGTTTLTVGTKPAVA